METALRNLLCESRSYREFLRLYFDHTRRSYAEVARRAGFSSRSYPRDVTEGRRRLTLRALPSLVRGLQLDSRLVEFFQLLYFQEFPDECPPTSARRSPTETEKRLRTRLDRARIRARNGKIRKEIPAEVLVAPEEIREETTRYLFEILASLGETQTGATLEEISRITGLTKTTLTPILEFAQRSDLVRFETQTNRYLPSSGHLNLTGMPKNELIRAIYMQALQRTRTAAEKAYTSEEALFYVSALSVAKKNLPALKRELREVLLKYMDAQAEFETQPDTVIYLVSSMFEARIARG